MRKRSHKPRQQKIAFLFGEGAKRTRRERGGKGLGLSELTSLGVPVPPGFTVTTGVARAYNQHGRLPNRLRTQLRLQMAALERETGKRFGDAEMPLLVSVRSGAEISMPGMLETVLNLGMNNQIAANLAGKQGYRFAYDLYRRFLSMFGAVVLEVDEKLFRDVLANLCRELDTEASKLDGQALEALCQRYVKLIEDTTGNCVPSDPWEQLELAVEAVLKSWDKPIAQTYRQANNIPNNLGTAVNVQVMVYGNRGEDSGTGVVFSRNVSTGEAGLWGEFMFNAQGEDLVAGIASPVPLSAMAKWNAALHRQLVDIVTLLEKVKNFAVEIEFTVENGQLFILQVREAVLTAEAIITLAVHFMWEGKLTKWQAVRRVPRKQLLAAQKAGFDPDALEESLADRFLCRGLSASPGAAIGRAVMSAEEAVLAQRRGETVILVRPDTSPSDLKGMMAGDAIVTGTGGTTCHAAVVARKLGKPCVVGCDISRIVPGAIISVDGSGGQVLNGRLPLTRLRAKKEVTLFLKWSRQFQARTWPAPRLCFETFAERECFNRLINDFYLTELMAETARGTPLESEARSVMQESHVEAAERIAMYLFVAIGGELRRTYEDCQGYDERVLRQLQNEFHMQMGGERDQAQENAVQVMRGMSRKKHVECLDLCARAFGSGTWLEDLVGGPAWEAIARTVHDFLTGDLSHTDFCDHAFDLEHNSGCVFGKHEMLDGDRLIVESQLEAKKRATNVFDLQRQLLMIDYSWSPSVMALHRKGELMQLW